MSVPRSDTGALGEKPKAKRDNAVKGIRQNGLVPSEEGVPVVCTKCGTAGLSDQGSRTV